VTSSRDHFIGNSVPIFQQIESSRAIDSEIAF
jgi:hypothetical protein